MDNDIQRDIIELKNNIKELISKNKILKLKLDDVTKSIERNKRDAVARDDTIKQSIPQIIQQTLRGLRK